MKQHILTTLLFSLFVAAPALAGVGKVSSPTVTKDKAEMEYSATRYDDRGTAKHNKQSHTLELEYGVSERLNLGLELKAARQAPDDTEFSAYGIEAQYEMTEQGDWWLGSALKGEYAQAAQRNEPSEAKLTLLLARSYGPSKLVANLSLAHGMGDNHTPGLALSSRMQAAHAYNAHFAPGVEWHADYGMLNRLDGKDTREHYVGPIIKGELFKLGSGGLDYVAGYYWGLTDASANNAARLQLSYGMQF